MKVKYLSPAYLLDQVEQDVSLATPIQLKLYIYPSKKTTKVPVVFQRNTWGVYEKNTNFHATCVFTFWLKPRNTSKTRINCKKNKNATQFIGTCQLAFLPNR